MAKGREVLTTLAGDKYPVASRYFFCSHCWPFSPSSYCPSCSRTLFVRQPGTTADAPHYRPLPLRDGVGLRCLPHYLVHVVPSLQTPWFVDRGSFGARCPGSAASLLHQMDRPVWFAVVELAQGYIYSRLVVHGRGGRMHCSCSPPFLLLLLLLSSSSSFLFSFRGRVTERPKLLLL